MTRHTRVLRIALCLALACGLLPARAAGKVEVKFVDPARFSDIGLSTADRDRVMRSLGDYLQSLGQRLPEGQSLRLDVLDIDLAGQLWPRRDGQEVRIVRDRADWPRMKIRYTLMAGGQTLKSGEDDLSDMDYRFGLRGYDLPDADLPYEKRMVREWFQKTFGTQ